jgi:hypothetical protein
MGPGQPCFAALTEGFPPPADGSPPKGSYHRLDFCVACWSAGHRPAPPLAVFSFWKTTIPTPTQKKKLLVDDAVLVDIFTRLGDRAAPADLHFRFVLALILMRKRLLRYDGMKPDDPAAPQDPASPLAEIWLMTPRGAQEQVHVINPRLTPDQIADVSTQLSSILAEEI